MNCGSLTVIHGLWLFLKLGRVSLRIVPSGRTMVFVAFRLLTLGLFIGCLGFIGTQSPMYRLKKIGLMVHYNIYANQYGFHIILHTRAMLHLYK